MRNVPKLAKSEEGPVPIDVPATPEQISAAATTGLPANAPGGMIAAAATKIADGVGVPRASEVSAEPAKVRRYRVKNEPPRGKPGYPVLQGGVTVFFVKGKVLDSLNFDIEYLKRQSVELEEIEG